MYDRSHGKTSKSQNIPSRGETSCNLEFGIIVCFRTGQGFAASYVMLIQDFMAWLNFLHKLFFFFLNSEKLHFQKDLIFFVLFQQ